MDTEIERNGARRTSSPALYEKYLCRAVDGIMQVTCKNVKDVDTANFNNEGMGAEGVRAVCGISERVATLSLGVPYVEKFYLAIRKKYYLNSVNRRTGTVLDCFVACCQPDEKMFEMKSRMGVYEMEVKT